MFMRFEELTHRIKGERIGTRRVDFFVEDKIMVEIKAVTDLNDIHLAQTINYWEAYNLPIGLLLNFGSRSLEFKRVYNTKHPEKQQYRDYNPVIIKSNES